MATANMELAPWQAKALTNPYTHFAMLCGIATGKTFTGAQFAIWHIVNKPELTGFIGANVYDQLSQASLRELFYWLDFLQIEYVIDRKPPPAWGAKRAFKDYHNILSCRVGDHVVTVFTRVLSDGNPLRGSEFGWYWIDETRDTPRNTHDIILSRLREDASYVKGLVTTTTAGEDWCYERFVSKSNTSKVPWLYGCMHVPTRESVRYGIISPDFYRALRASYSPVMAAQELDARHVTIRTGRAYYTIDDRNARWGFAPDPTLPLIVGMDFNYSPCPMVWEIGQWDPINEKMHWFAELSDTEISSRQMARRLGMQFGEFFLRIFGDASGTRGTTSNAGETDFNQIADELTQMGVQFTMDTDQSNPMVRDRVENMCRLGRDANGTISMTIDPDGCPLLWQDLHKVVWKPNGKTGSDKGDDPIAHLLTHGSDGAGYAMWKVAPPRTGVLEIGHKVRGMHGGV